MLPQNSSTAALLIIVCEHDWHKNSDVSVCQDCVWEECSYSADQCARLGLFLWDLEPCKGYTCRILRCVLTTAGGLELLKGFKLRQTGDLQAFEQSNIFPCHYRLFGILQSVKLEHFLAMTLECWPQGIIGH